MEYIEDFSDERLKAWCIQCRMPASEVKLTRDHVPSKSLLFLHMVQVPYAVPSGSIARPVPHKP
jgi:hypothetical protein